MTPRVRIQPSIPAHLYDYFEPLVGPTLDYSDWSHLVAIALERYRKHLELEQAEDR